ncbi:MAG: haloacid dehalogenase type II [Thermoleophilia bacterium]
MFARELRSFDVLTFDCFGTLIDWERGLLSALHAVLNEHRLVAGDDTLLESYASHEAALERGEFRHYRDVLAGSFLGVCAELGFSPTADEEAGFVDSIGQWPAFADAAVALARLQTTYRLAVITNCDDDLFAVTSRKLGVTFDWVVTAEQAHSYKPSLWTFEFALARIGVPPERVLHVAQSLYHDHVPARRLGLATVWIDRRHDRLGFGATPPAAISPDLRFDDLTSFADAALGGAA